jgi:hypothetical protein
MRFVFGEESTSKGEPKPMRMIVAGMYWEQAVAPGGSGVGVGDGSGVVLTR